MKTAIPLVVASLLLLAGCGGDDETATRSGDNTVTAGGDASREPRAIGEAMPGGVAEGGGGRVSRVRKGASEIRIEAARRGPAYETRHVTIEPGETLLHFENPQSEPHDVDLEDAEGKLIADMETIAGGYADVPIYDLEPGEHTFYCSVPGHREAGMEGTVTVE